MSYFNSIQVENQSVISTGNSTTAVLASGATFTGTAEEVTQYSQITNTFATDVAGATNLSASYQFSQDGTNWDARIPTTSAQAVQGAGNWIGFHSFAPTARYFRVVYTNGDTVQTFFRMQTIYTIFKNLQLVSRADQLVNRSNDVQLTRAVSDPDLDNNIGFVDYRTTVHKFGHNGAVGDTFETVWEGPTAVYPFPTSGSTLRIAAGGNAADDFAGAGARTVVIQGLLASDWTEATETIQTSGTGVSAESANTYIRLNRAYVSDCGTYGAANTAAINIEHTLNGNVVGTIAVEMGQTEQTVNTVPAGHTAYLRDIEIVISDGNTSDIRMFQRQNADTFSAPFQSRRIVAEINDSKGAIERSFHSWVAFPAMTDIWVEARKITGGGSAGVAVDYDVTLIENR